jgi:GTP-binding protein HflX
MEEGLRQQLKVGQEKVILVACMLPGNNSDPNDPLGELRSLVDTAGGIVVDELFQNRHKPDSATYIGSGKVRELAEMVQAHGAQAVVFDNDLSPAQISNIEEEVKCKILDRSEVILDIFAARAQTNEAKLQVELAQLIYTYPRLRAMWSHLERITGGSPVGMGTRGPGEQQLEIDRRIVKHKVSVLKKLIADIQTRKAREVAARNKDNFTVGLVGYTNAGKSTLFNTLTDAGAYADDRLFATLSTLTRKWNLGLGDSVMLSDTVGFVSDLPHHLVASFKATLEEAVHSDLLLIVLDVSDPRTRHQYETVNEVLKDIGADHQPRILLLNKIDRLENNAELLLFEKEVPDSLAISAQTGRGLDKLVERVREALRGGVNEISLSIPMSDGKAIGFLETRATVLDRQYEGANAIYKVRIGKRHLDQLKSSGVTMTVLES